jgi:hypothetical protein
MAAGPKSKSNAAADPSSNSTAFRKFFKRKYSGVQKRLQKRSQGGNYVYFWNNKHHAQKTGIYVRGGCDLMAVFAAEPLINPVLKGSCCIYRGGIGASSSRSDILLQTQIDLDRAVLAPVQEKLKLPRRYFRTDLFSPAFKVPRAKDIPTFSKDVVVLSIAPDVVRTAYQHREHGFVVDPGGWWLNQKMDNVLSDMDTVMWFNRSFKKLGQLGLAEAFDNWREIIIRLRTESGAQIVMFNVLGIEPGNQTYDYQYVRNSQVIRRREFNLALYELSRDMNFPIVDIDRLLKREGVQKQVDFAHWPIERFDQIAGEVFGTFQELGVFS